MKAPVRLFLAFLTPAISLDDAVVVVLPEQTSDRRPVRPPGPPAYIVFSTLLI